MDYAKCPLCGSTKFKLRSDGDFMDLAEPCDAILNCARPSCSFALIFVRK